MMRDWHRKRLQARNEGGVIKKQLNILEGQILVPSYMLL